MKSQKNFFKPNKKLFRSILFFLIAISLIFIEIVTPPLFLTNKENINLNFKAHLADHDGLPQPICEKINGNNFRTYTLTASEIRWEVGPGQYFTAWVFNNDLPGPSLCAYEGEELTILVNNTLDTDIMFEIYAYNESSSSFEINIQTVIVKVNQIETIKYIIPVNSSGTLIYQGLEGVSRGLYGAFVIYGQNEVLPSHDIVIIQDEFRPPVTDNNDYFAVQNGRIYPYTIHYIFQQDEVVRFRVINFGPGEDHTIHIHGQTWQDKDGKNVDNELVFPNELVDRYTTMREPGMWMYHCHIYDHIAAGMTGMLTVIPKDFDGDPRDYVVQLLKEGPQ